MNQDTVRKLKARYPNIFPLLFSRTVERARSEAELFDLLESMPKNFPIVWCEEYHSWTHTEDIIQTKEFLIGE